MPPKKLNDRAQRIIELCADTREKFTPDGETTYCNLAVREVCHSFAEYIGFGNMLANNMVLKMENSAEWAKVDAEAAKRLADDGNLVIAARRGNPHGHCCIVVPGRAMVTSGKWGEKVPFVSNVGKSNWVCGANYAFQFKPSYYVLIEDA